MILIPPEELKPGDRVRLNDKQQIVKSENGFPLSPSTKFVAGYVYVSEYWFTQFHLWNASGGG